MGLGKTLSIISLIVTNYKDGQPLVTIDKESSVQHTVVKKVWLFIVILQLPSLISRSSDILYYL